MLNSLVKRKYRELKHPAFVAVLPREIKGISRCPQKMVPPSGKRDPYHSHTTPIKSWKFMGSLWEPYGKGVAFLGGTWKFP